MVVQVIKKMGKSKSNLHSNVDVKMEVEEDVKPSVNDLDVKNVVETPMPTKVGQDEYDELCTMVNAIAHPLAPRKASKDKQNLRQGMCDVQKALRRNETGVVVLAGNVSPVDVYSHVPGICEEKDIPYIFTPSREHLGLATGHRRAAILLLIKEHADYADLFHDVSEMIKKIAPDS
ncbi:putative H/ACA ribonucleoprotein complex subunit 2-like protein [Dirofilaria immitis]|nr:putative H/ACA ribonucleoprotein complex subunit 2-like protein [Dirofilaria immitis]